MSKSRGYLTGLCLLVGLVLCLSACGREPVPPEHLLTVMMAQEPELPAGQVYRDGALPGEAGYADEELIAVLFGDGAMPIEMRFVRSYAIRLCSLTRPFEMAVFLCTSETDAFAVGEMCQRRLDTVRKTCRETEWETAAEAGQVTVRGKYVILALCPHSDEAIDAVRRTLRGNHG